MQRWMPAASFVKWNQLTIKLKHKNNKYISAKINNFYIAVNAHTYKKYISKVAESSEKSKEKI